MRELTGEKKMKQLSLFGGDEAWHEDDWVAVNDTLRGGKSESYLCCNSEDVARFYGTLDIKTLGGAGFASQRTNSDDLKLDLSDYAGIQLCIAKGDKKRYTFILKDDLSPQEEKSTPERSSISWECDFVLPPEGEPDDAHDRTVFIPWAAFLPTYRGQPKKDVEPLKLTHIKRVSIMMRSFFGAQEGDFSLSIRSISALSETPKSVHESGHTKHIDARHLEDGTAVSEQDPHVASFGGRRWLLATDRHSVAYTITGLVIILALYYRFVNRGL